MEFPRKTKIVCTIGPASSSPEMIAALMDSGMNVARLNFSHGSHSDHSKVYEQIRKTAGEKNLHIGILQDLQGPKIRIGKVQPLQDGGVPLIPEQKITISVDAGQADGREVFSTTYQALVDDLNPGDRLLIDDGRIELKVLEINRPGILCSVVTGGILKSNKGINLPGVKVSAASPTAKDLEDLQFGLDLGVDFIALSFVRNAQEIMSVKNEIHRCGLRTQVIAKIERPEALENLDSIIQASDGLMVARGDLGVEIGPHRVPLIQKKILERASRHCKFVITATQMLESMISAPMPTRAEASDVANAVLDGSGALMLSGETASGAYPLEAVKMMSRIITEVEHLVCPPRDQDLEPSQIQMEAALSASAVTAAGLMGAKAMVAFTQTGATALSISRNRSAIPLMGASPCTETLQKLSMYWGVEPMAVSQATDTDSMIENLEGLLLSDSRFKAGDLVVITAGTPLSRPGSTNLMKALRLGRPQDIPGDGVATPFFRINLDQSRCTLCGSCVRICPARLFKNSQGTVVTVPEQAGACLGDRLCEKNCQGAITITSLEDSLPETERTDR